MKKIIFSIGLIVAMMSASLLVCLAAYNYSSPPAGFWNFTANRSYTVNGNMDVHYYFNGLSGKANSRTEVKARYNYYSYAFVRMVGVDGVIKSASNANPTVTNTTGHSGWGEANTPYPQYIEFYGSQYHSCLLYTSDAADEL